MTEKLKKLTLRVVYISYFLVVTSSVLLIIYNQFPFRNNMNNVYTIEVSINKNALTQNYEQISYVFICHICLTILYHT